ncbi:hypothetical protein HY989_05730 [Candidatus Micrarchaeota archaeon]|nr:hypothetical protein [Candidatus Micrarchaeota archaeon]
MPMKFRESYGKKIKLFGGAAALALGVGLGALSINEAKKTEILSPDYTGRQKLFTLNPKSMELYKGLPEQNFKIGETRYRLGHSLERFGLDTYDINIDNQKKGELKERFKVFGRKVSIETLKDTTEISRPFQFFVRHKWTLNRNGGPYLKLIETNKSYWIPTVHAYDLFDAKTGDKVGYLSAKWNMRRFLLGRRDYGVKFEPGKEQTLTKEEIVGLLTSLGKMFVGSSSSSSSSNKK